MTAPPASRPGAASGALPAPARCIDELEQALAVAAHGEDPEEGVHRARVAALRLSVWLELADRRMLRDDLRWLRASLRRARDLDVLQTRAELRAELPGAWQAEVQSALRGERLEAQSQLESCVLGARTRALVLALRLGTAQPAARQRAACRALERRVERRARHLRREPDSLPRLHALRRALRRLRYARDWLGQPSDALREVQHQLGRVCERALALEWAERAPAPGAAASRPHAPGAAGAPGADEPARARWLADQGAQLRAERAAALAAFEALAGQGKRGHPWKCG